MATLTKLFRKGVLFALKNRHAALLGERTCFSSVAAATQQSPKFLRTDLSVDQLSLENEAQWIHIPNEIYESLSFEYGLKRPFRRMAQTIRDCSFLIRRPALDVVNALSYTKPDNPIVRYVLYGKYGCGKTMTLHHVLHWAHQQNWVVCFFPRAYIYRRNVKESIQSTWKNNRIDLPEESSLWLKQFQKANLHLLSNPKLVTTKTYNWAPGEVTEMGRPLLDVIRTGTTRIKTASDCMAVLLKELKCYASSKEIKLLVAVDQINSFFGPTNLRRIDNYYAQPEDVTIMRAVLETFKFDWNNGAVVGTIDAFEKEQHLPGSPPTAHLPYYLLGRDGMTHLEPFVPIEIPPYTFEEASSCVDYYVDRHWLIDPEVQKFENRQELFQLAGFNPMLIERICSER